VQSAKFECHEGILLSSPLAGILIGKGKKNPEGNWRKLN
jgi:hypothetical protein